MQMASSCPPHTEQKKKDEYKSQRERKGRKKGTGFTSESHDCFLGFSAAWIPFPLRWNIAPCVTFPALSDISRAISDRMHIITFISHSHGNTSANCCLRRRNMQSEKAKDRTYLSKTVVLDRTFLCYGNPDCCCCWRCCLAPKPPRCLLLASLNILRKSWLDCSSPWWLLDVCIALGGEFSLRWKGKIRVWWASRWHNVSAALHNFMLQFMLRIYRCFYVSPNFVNQGKTSCLSFILDDEFASPKDGMKACLPWKR